MRARQGVVVVCADGAAAVRGPDVAVLPQRGVARVTSRFKPVKGRLPAAGDTRQAGPLSLLKGTKE